MVEIAAELVVDDVERERVNCRVDEHEAEGGRLEDMPVLVVAADVVEVPDEQPGMAR